MTVGTRKERGRSSGVEEEEEEEEDGFEAVDDGDDDDGDDDFFSLFRTFMSFFLAHKGRYCLRN